MKQASFEELHTRHNSFNKFIKCYVVLG